MTIDDLKNLVKEIVEKACDLKQKVIKEEVLVNYACIFSQNEEEYVSFIELVKQMGKIVQETEMGPVFQITPLLTISGLLDLLKIRKPDPTRPEKGDADFTLSNYERFKEEHFSKPGFRLIKKENFEMIEYVESGSDVRIYFSNPTLGEVLGIK